MKSKKAAWLVAATTSAMTALFIAAAIMDHIAGVTIVDVGALLITGILTGLFLGYYLASNKSGPSPEHRG
jgi:hypothetical protein